MDVTEAKRKILLNVYDYFEKEKNHGGPLTSVMAVQQRTADAVKVCRQTVAITCAMRENGSDLKKIINCRPKKCTTELPETKKQTIRWLIYEMYAKKEHITLDTLLTELKLKQVCDFGRSSLRLVLKEMGFKFKQTDNRRGLCEQSHVVSMRNVFLRKYLKNLQSEIPHEFVFLDETWIFSRGASKRSWQDDSVKSLKQPTKASDGKRYIIVHAGGRNGFIEGGSLIFSTTSKSADYHDSMNSVLFEKWFEECILQKLEKPSIIVLDNASYHTRKSEKVPTASSTKADITTWLKSKNIQFDIVMLKAELLQLVKKNNQGSENKHVVDEMALKYGHEVLRLPPYHCHFNPIELVWGIAKKFYDDRIGATSGKEEDVIKTWNDALTKITPDVWNRCVTHTEEIIKDTYRREKIVDDVRPLVFSVNTDSDIEDDNFTFSDSDKDF